MRLSLDGYLEILSHEAIVTSRYKDSVGVWTISVGHTKAAGGVDPAKVTRTLSVEECLDIFLEDVPKYEARVNRSLKGATQQEFDAGVSFDFNTGAIHRASWVKLFNAGDKAGAVRSIMNWKKPPEIIARRKKERDLLAHGTYSHTGKVNVYPASSSGRVQWSKGKRIDIRDTLRRRLQGHPPPPKRMKTFTMYSKHELRFEGVVFPDGHVAIRSKGSTDCWDSMEDMMATHGERVNYE